MKLSQNWVGYLDRSYQQIKSSVLKRLSIVAPEISDHSESNPLVIIISLFSGIAEVIHLYLDRLARELFLGTAMKYASARKIGKLVDYPGRARYYASGRVKFTLVNGQGELTPYTGGAIIIPKGSKLTTALQPLEFILIGDVIIGVNQTTSYGDVAQYIQVNNKIIGTTDGTAYQSINLPNDYSDNSIFLTIDNEIWNSYNSFGYMKPDTRGFIVEISENGIPVLKFGDGTNGRIPDPSKTIYATYKITEGVYGNVPPNNLTIISTPLTLPTNYNLQVTNPNYLSGGYDFETLDDIKNRAPRSLRTLDRAVSYQDFVDLALLHPGVGAADVKYCCGKFISVFVAPNSRGIASAILLQDVQNSLNCRKMITTFPKVIPAGITRAWIKATIYGKPLFTQAEIYNDVVNALDLAYGFGALELNRTIALSDIIALLEGLIKVESISIEKLKIEPFARQSDETSNPLNIEFVTLPLSADNHTYTIRYKQGTNNFDIYRDDFYLQSIALNTPYNDSGIVAFTITDGLYEDNDEWTFQVFKTYPEIFPDSKVVINDYSATIIDVSPFVSDAVPRTIFSDLTIITQANSTKCLPNC